MNSEWQKWQVPKSRQDIEREEKIDNARVLLLLLLLALAVYSIYFVELRVYLPLKISFAEMVRSNEKINRIPTSVP